MSDLLTAPRGELLKLVYELIDENQTLKIRITELQEENQRLKENFKDRGKSGTPSFVKASVKKQKKDLSLRKRRERGFVDFHHIV